MGMCPSRWREWSVGHRPRVTPPPQGLSRHRPFRLWLCAVPVDTGTPPRRGRCRRPFRLWECAVPVDTGTLLAKVGVPPTFSSMGMCRPGGTGYPSSRRSVFHRPFRLWVCAVPVDTGTPPRQGRCPTDLFLYNMYLSISPRLHNNPS